MDKFDDILNDLGGIDDNTEVHKSEDDLSPEHEVSIFKLFNQIIIDGIENNEDSILLDAYKNRKQLSYEKYGKIIPARIIPEEVYPELISRIKIKAGLNIIELSHPQNGKLVFKHNDYLYKLYVATVPTMYGECVSMLFTNKKQSDLIMISDYTRKIIDNPPDNTKLIFVSSEEEASCNAAYYSVMDILCSSNRRVVNIRDNGKFDISVLDNITNNVVHLDIKNDIGYTLLFALRSSVLLKPNIIMVNSFDETNYKEDFLLIDNCLVIRSLLSQSCPDSCQKVFELTGDKQKLVSLRPLFINFRSYLLNCFVCAEEVDVSIDDVMWNDIVSWYIKDYGDEKVSLKLGEGCGSCKGTGISGHLIQEESLSCGAIEMNFNEEAPFWKNHTYLNNHTHAYPENIDIIQMFLKGIISIDSFQNIKRIK